MTERVNFMLAFNGVTYRFASLLTGDDLLRAVRAKVAAIVNCKEAEMYWRDDESDIVLETVEDLATAIDYAKATRRKPSKTPCVHLVAVVPAPPAEEKPEESTAATVDDLVDGLQKVTIAEEAVEPWQTMFSPPRVVNVKSVDLMGIPLKLREMMKELDATEAAIAEIVEAVDANGRDLEKVRKLQKMRATRKETAVPAAKADAASCRLRVDDANTIYRASSPSRKQRRIKSTVEEQKRIREHSILPLSEDFPERYSMAAAAIVNSERRMMTRREITEWAKIAFPAFKALGVRYKDDIRKSLRNADCFVKVPRPSKEESKGNLWTINPKYVIDEQMHLECAQNVTQLDEPAEHAKSAVKANSALQQEGMLSPTKKKEAQHARKDWKIHFDKTAAERKVDKTRKITDWAQPAAAAAAPTIAVYRSAMKKAVASQPTGRCLGGTPRDITSAERIVNKTRKITDWAQPVPPRLGARDITSAERVVKKERKITDWAQPVAAAAAPTAEVYRASMKKAARQPTGLRGTPRDITSAERVVKKEKKITDWTQPVAAAAVPTAEVYRSSMKKAVASQAGHSTWLEQLLSSQLRAISSAERMAKKEKKITDWSRPVGAAPKEAASQHASPSVKIRHDITSAESSAKKEKKITDWARPEPPRVGARDITAAELTVKKEKKEKKITDWARPVAAAAPLCSSSRLGARDITAAERIAKKERKITDWARPVKPRLEIIEADTIVKKARKITDWARPAAAAPKIKCPAALQQQGLPVKKEAYLERPRLERMETDWKVMKTDWAQRVAAALKTKRAAKIAQEHNKNATAASAALQREGGLKAPMKKEAASEEPNALSINGPMRKETPAKTKLFISYRRKSGESLASLVRVLLQLRGYEALMVTDKWDTGTLEAMIKGAQHFIAVLTPKSLHDFDYGDRFHKELRCAFAHRKPIIPMFDQFFEFPEDEDAIPQDIRRIASLSGVRWVHAYQEQCMNHVERKMRSNEKTTVPVEAVAELAKPARVDVEIAQLTPIYSPVKTKKEVEEEERETDEATKGLNFKVYISYRRGPDDELASLVKAHLIQRGYEDFVNENDDSEPLAAKVKSAAHFVVLLTPYSFEYFKRDSVFSKELQCAISHKKHLVFLVGKHFEYPAHKCGRENPIPKDIRKLLDETEKGGYVSIMLNNEDQDGSMDKLHRMLRNADHSQFNDRRCKKNQEQRKRELDAITQTFKKDLAKREREFHQMLTEAAAAAPEAAPITAEAHHSAPPVEKEVVEMDEVKKVDKEAREPAEPNILKVHMAERRKREQRELRQRENERRQKRVLKRLVKSKMRQLKTAVGTVVAEVEAIKSEMQQASPAEEKEWEEVDEVKNDVEEDGWSHGEESSIEDEDEVNAKHNDEWCYDEAENDIFLSAEDVGVEKKEEDDEWAFDGEADAVFEKMVTEDDGEDHSDEWSCEDVKDTEEDQNDEDLTSISDEDSSDDVEAELSVREEQLAVKEEAFERRMVEFAVKMEELEEKMKVLEKRIEKVEKEKKKKNDDYDTDQEYDDLLGEREAARSALPALRQEIQATLLAQTMKYKMKK